MSRAHPFDLIGAALGEAWFGEVDAAVAAAACDPADRLAFQRLGPVQRVLGELRPAGGEGPGALCPAFWRAGSFGCDSLLRRETGHRLGTNPPARIRTQ